MRTFKPILLGLTIATISWGVAFRGEAAELPSAKQALALANEQVDADVKDQVVVMVGVNSDSDLRPRVWEIVLYDPNRINDGVKLTVKDGAVTAISSSLRMFDDGRWKSFSRNFSGYWPEEIINVGRWAKDSDAIIEAVKSHASLAEYAVTELQFNLRKLSDGDVPPAWRVRVRARPKDNAFREHWVGYLQFNADTGELLRDELTVK